MRRGLPTVLPSLIDCCGWGCCRRFSNTCIRQVVLWSSPSAASRRLSSVASSVLNRILMVSVHGKNSRVPVPAFQDKREVGHAYVDGICAELRQNCRTLRHWIVYGQQNQQNGALMIDFADELGENDWEEPFLLVLYRGFRGWGSK